MTITKVNKNFEKGLVIRVGNKQDGIMFHVAETLKKRNQPNGYNLDSVKISKSDKLIYLVGHGSVTKHCGIFKKYAGKIDKLSMSDIAEKLVNAGYDGSQCLYLTACDSKFEFDGKSIYSELKEELKKRINVEPNIESDFDGKSIIINRNGEIEFWNLKVFNLKEQLDMLRQLIRQELCYKKKSDYDEINDFKMELIKHFGGKI